MVRESREPVTGPAQVDPRLVAASVLISNDLGGSISGGSGTVVAVEEDRALVLTCRHLFPGGRAGRIVVRFPSGRGCLATLLALDDRADLAALAIAAEPATPWVPVSSRAVVPGERVWQVGYPHGQGPRERHGSSLGLRGHVQPNVPVTGFRLSTTSGDSGSGIFRTSDSTLVGVLWGGTGGETSATGIEEISRFLEHRCCRWFPCFRPSVRPPRLPMVAVPVAPFRPAAPGGVSPAPSGPPPSAPILAPVGPDYQTLVAELRQLRADVEALKRQPPERGPQGATGLRGDVGPAGPAGPMGPAGKDGRDGKDADTAALQAQITVLKQDIEDFKASLRVKVMPIR